MSLAKGLGASCSFSVSWFPGAHGVFGVVSGVRRRSKAPWVCRVLGSPYVPLRGAWVLSPGGATVVKLLGATTVKPLGIVSGRELLPTRVVLVGGGILNRDRSPVKGTGGGSRASGCHVCGGSEDRSSSLEAGDDIVDREWRVSPVSPWDSPSAEESESLQMSVDLLSVDEREDKDGGEGHGNRNGDA